MMNTSNTWFVVFKQNKTSTTHIKTASKHKTTAHQTPIYISHPHPPFFMFTHWIFCCFFFSIISFSSNRSFICQQPALRSLLSFVLLTLRTARAPRFFSLIFHFVIVTHSVGFNPPVLCESQRDARVSRSERQWRLATHHTHTAQRDSNVPLGVFFSSRTRAMSLII